MVPPNNDPNGFEDPDEFTADVDPGDDQHNHADLAGFTGRDDVRPAVFTVGSVPPHSQDKQRRSRWAQLFEECREHNGEWRRLIEPLRKTTAAQIASDIRNAHHRDLDKTRLRGFEPGDHWEAVWGHAPDDANPGNYYVWLRYVANDTNQGSNIPPN
jgi:hypothetical protein